MTGEELIAELEALYSANCAGPDDVFTVTELADLMGLGEKSIRRRLRQAKKLGRLDVIMVVRENLNGVAVPVPAYRLRSN